ncbi:MAG: AI-2E family transporter [Bacteroidales bacterium]|nr:AI-2E family transporter [Bacteroidales bacterium]MBR6161491.1 AI-2E family transporter [Bacteroidales bacterium]
MEKERSIDKLARYIIILGTLAIAAVLCYFFSSVLAYILLAFVVSLIGQPVFKLLKKIKIKGKSAPDALLSVITIIIIFALLCLLVLQVIPVVSGILRDASLMNTQETVDAHNLINRANDWIIRTIPWVGEDFNGVEMLIQKLSEVLDLSDIPAILGSVASAVAGLAVGLFSVLFISFFFTKDETLFGRIIGSLAPDSIEEKVKKTILDIERLLSRYFVGLIMEIFGVVVLDCLGLWLIARIGFNYALGIAFIAGLLNIIPYVGPLIGEAIGVVLCLILKYGAGVGLNVNIWIFALIVLAIMLTVQLVDNFIYQPLIYSTSIKAHPLEIFIVLLIAGNIGGIVGMLIAIPSYTVIRVIASRFFYDKKIVRRLIPDVENENTDALV